MHSSLARMQVDLVVFLRGALFLLNKEVLASLLDLVVHKSRPLVGTLLVCVIPAVCLLAKFRLHPVQFLSKSSTGRSLNR